jgi:hypothetical protein
LRINPSPTWSRFDPMARVHPTRVQIQGQTPWRHQVIWRSVHPELETLHHQSSSSS